MRIWIVMAAACLMLCACGSSGGMSNTINVDNSRSVSLEDTARWYLEPLAYGLGNRSWATAEEANPNALVIFYYLAHADGTGANDQQDATDRGYATPPIAADELESFVQQYFDVSIRRIRGSQYYIASENHYYVEGIGSTIELELLGTEIQGDLLTILHSSSIVTQGLDSSWTGELVLRYDESVGYRYESYEQSPVTSHGILNDSYGSYARPFCGPLGDRTWEDADEANADGFVDFYMYHSIFLQEGNGGSPVPETPAQQLEETINRYFTANAWHLRTSQYYNKSTDTYNTSEWNLTGDITVTHALSHEDSLVLKVVWNDPLDQRHSWMGEITLERDEEVGYRYCSFERTGK